MRLDRNGQGRGQSSSHRHPNAKLSEEQVRAVRRMHAAGTPARLLAAGMGVTKQTIHKVVACQSYREVTP